MDQPHLVEMLERVAAAIKYLQPTQTVVKYEQQGIQYIVKDESGRFIGQMIVEIIDVNDTDRKPEAHEITLIARPLIELPQEKGKKIQARPVEAPQLGDAQINGFHAELSRLNTGRWDFKLELHSPKTRPKLEDPQYVQLTSRLLYHRDDEFPAHSIAYTLHLMGTGTLRNRFQELCALEHYGQTEVPPIK